MRMYRERSLGTHGSAQQNCHPEMTPPLIRSPRHQPSFSTGESSSLQGPSAQACGRSCVAMEIRAADKII
jgi:hypothetical protein